MTRPLLPLALWVLGSVALAQPAAVNPPKSLACLGDSITVGIGSSAASNWCNGTTASVSSHYTRLQQLVSPVASQNQAQAGAEMRGLMGQVARITGTPEYVVILMGANDVCATSEAAMTSIAEFRADFTAALAALTRKLPNARVYVLSIPNVYRLWEVLHTNGLAVSTWENANICQSMLDAPTDEGADAMARRDRVRQRIIDFNTVLLEVCETSLHCRYDDGAVFGFEFSAEAVWTTDYFHPSTAGQTQLASLSWAAGFDFSDREIPLSQAQPLAADGGVALLVTDNVGPRGVEYFLDGADAGTWLRYQTPLEVASTETVFYRGVDVNGNTENTRSFNPVTGDDGGVRDGGGSTGGGGGVIIGPGGGDAGELPEGGCNCGAGGGALTLGGALLGVLALLRSRFRSSPVPRAR